MHHLIIKKNKFRVVLSVIAVLFLFLTFAGKADAASLSFSLQTSTVTVGNIVTARVMVNTEGRAINSADVAVQFPTDLLEVVSVSKGSSIFSLWVDEPKFSNSDGKVTLSGGLPNPGYTGLAGEIVAITFRAKRGGAATLGFADSSVRLNDGLGTNALSSKLSANLGIVDTLQQEVPVVAPTNGLPGKPAVVSSSHPDQNVWYTNKNATFSWVVPEGVIAVQTLLGKSPDSVPTITYDSSVSQRTVSALPDGVLYFHIRYQNSFGWGSTTHYKIQIDSTAPEKLSTHVENRDVNDVLVINATDSVSGIESYAVKVDQGDVLRVKASDVVNGEYQLPTQNPGDHAVVVTAYDRAGNHSETSATYTSKIISAPTLALSSKQVVTNGSIDASGTTKYPNAPVSVFVAVGDQKPLVYNTTARDDGSYKVAIDKIKTSGRYKVWAQIQFSDSVKSPVSEPVFLDVSDTPFTQTTKLISYVLAAVIPIIILIIGLVMVAYVGWHRFFGMKKQITKDLEATAHDVHDALSVFRQELNKQLNALERIKNDRVLNKKEEKIFNELQENVDGIEDFIAKKIKKIIKK